MRPRASPTRTPRLAFRAIRADGFTGPLSEVFDEYWPAYRRWIRRAPALDPGHCATQLRDHMPELAPIFNGLHAMAGGGDLAARFLSLYSPPRLVRGCSQVVIDEPDGPVLLRTYDHSPLAFDAIVLAAEWEGVRTLALTDCLWGALDGVNEHGLAVALAFGGRNSVGPGFAAPLVVRYLLQTCATVDEAITALQRIPVYMPYIFVVVDARGDHTTAFTGPDRPATFRHLRASTNHEHEDDWPAYRDHTNSVERLNCLQQALESGHGFDRALHTCLTPPVWRADYARGAGTLYAAAYRPGVRSLDLHWPGRTESFQLSNFTERVFSVKP